MFLFFACNINGFCFLDGGLFPMSVLGGIVVCVDYFCQLYALYSFALV